MRKVKDGVQLPIEELKIKENLHGKTTTKGVKMRLSDEAIAQIVKLIQVGFLSGTDISDHIRTLELTSNGDKLDPDPEYLRVFEENLKKMNKEAEELQVREALKQLPTSDTGFGVETSLFTLKKSN